jgi:hypothetical protein
MLEVSPSGGPARRASRPERPAAAQTAERDYDLNRAAELKYGTLLQLQRQLKEAEEELAAKVRRQPARAPRLRPARSLILRVLAPHACPGGRSAGLAARRRARRLRRLRRCRARACCARR